MASRPVLVWVIAALAFLAAGWMAFDGTYALLVGDYVTPTEGEHAGELGPWAALVEAIGIEPRSTFMKAFFVGYGVLWLGVIATFLATGRRWTYWAMLAAAIGSLWYLVIGTVFSLVLIALLALPRGRRGVRVARVLQEGGERGEGRG